jgi:ABC-2 type transport system permease protein
MRAFAVLARVELAMLLREPAAVFFTLGLPLVLLVLNSRTGRMEALLPGYLVYVMATSAIMALPETLADYRDRGVLRRMRVSPLRAWQIIGAHAATHLAMVVAGVVVLTGVGAAAFGTGMPAGWVATGFVSAVAAAAVIALGFLLASVMPTVRTTQAVAAALYFPAIFVSGALFPRDQQPGLVQRIGDFLPLTYAVEAIGGAWRTATVDWTAVAVLAATFTASTAIAVRTFRWESR